MAEVVVFHHVQGVTGGVRAFADLLRSDGHTVHAVDLYEGRTFDDFEEGMAHARTVGFATILERGKAAAADLPAAVVYVGFSLGVLPAQLLAQTRPGCRGAVLLESCVPAAEFGVAWPADVPVQIHGMDDDPSFAHEGDIEAARELVATVPDGELFVYPGDVHLFTDPSLPTYDEAAAKQVVERVRDFVRRVG
jgi:dienelactone hydrolase